MWPYFSRLWPVGSAIFSSMSAINPSMAFSQRLAQLANIVVIIFFGRP